MQAVLAADSAILITAPTALPALSGSARLLGAQLIAAASAARAEPAPRPSGTPAGWLPKRRYLALIKGWGIVVREGCTDERQSACQRKHRGMSGCCGLTGALPVPHLQKTLPDTS